MPITCPGGGGQRAAGVTGHDAALVAIMPCRDSVAAVPPWRRR
jgi:hypothetical protein